MVNKSNPQVLTTDADSSELTLPIQQQFTLSEDKQATMDALRLGGLSNTRMPGASLPLSIEQQEIWSRSQLALNVPHQILVLERKGPLDRGALEQTFTELTRRHATLRTRFVSINGTATQIIAEQSAGLPWTELSGLADLQHEAEVLRVIAEEARRPFHLSDGPAARVRLLQFSSEKHVLIVTLHAIVADAWSLNVLAYEVDSLYRAYSAGGQCPLADLPMQYADYSVWQAGWLNNEVVDQQLSYWRKRFADSPPVLELPDRPRSCVQNFRGACQSLVLSKELSHSLKALSKKEGVTLFATLLAGLQALLSRYTGQDDIPVGCIVSGRDEMDLEGLIGPFAHTVITRTCLGDDPTVREFLQRVGSAVQNDCAHQSVPLEHLISKLQPKHDSISDTLYRVLFSVVPSISGHSWHPIDMELDTGEVKTDVQLKVYDRPENLVARFTYNSDLFDASTIIRMARHFQTVLQGIIADPDQPVSRLPLLTFKERDQLLSGWNDNKRDYPKHRCVHQLFEEQVELTPDATAVVFENHKVSYRKLNSRANQLAHHLLKLGVGADALVGICVQRSPNMLAGLLGIWKAGCAYVPLDPQYPSDRLSFMLEDSGLKVLITEKPLLPKFSGYKGQVVYVDSEVIDKERSENCSTGATSDNLAYVIYTSGSTGKPKGVQICHQSLVNFLVSMRSTPGLTPEDTLLAVTTISFDIAALELYLPLIVGARIVLVSRETAADGYQLREKLERIAPTVMQATPATWRLLVEAGWRGSKNLKILCGGEAMPRALAGELLNRALTVWNMYGPTETTVWSTTSQITSSDAPITVGKPIANTEIYVLDNHLEPVPVGVSGELYIGGDGVARGYLHRPDLTAEKFVLNPFRDQRCGARLYRTGDIARFRTNGELECLGRIDNQVKVRGFRIELGEIESVLGQYPGVKQAVVVTREDSPGDKRLVAYVAVNQGQSPGVDALREFLKRTLPDYMLPSRFVPLEALPLTPNGKVDRRALPVPEQLELTPQKGHVVSRNSIESRLIKIWESVLNIHGVGVTDNFFELGGHSLLVAKLLRRIEHTFGKKLSMAAIFEAPTIEQQASVLGDSSALRWPSTLAPIQPTGSRPPFFCFGFGAGPVFRTLAERLGSDQPLIAVDPSLLDGSQVPAPYKMEDVAACLTKQIRELQPDGPYYLGGICGGGLVAYATATNLQAQAQTVALLALFEPHTSYQDHSVKHSNGSRGGRWLSQRVKFHTANLQLLEFEEAMIYIRDRSRAHTRVLSGKLKGLLRKTLCMHNGRGRNIQDILGGPACRAYLPEPFVGRVALFQATHREPESDWERQYWIGLAPNLEIHEVPGYSNWIVRFFVEPTVEILASKLRAYLPGCETPEAEG